MTLVDEVLVLEVYDVVVGVFYWLVSGFDLVCAPSVGPAFLGDGKGGSEVTGNYIRDEDLI